MSTRNRRNAHTPMIQNRHPHPIYPTLHYRSSPALRTQNHTSSTHNNDKRHRKTQPRHREDPHLRILINWGPARPCRAARPTARKIHYKIVSGAVACPIEEA